MKLHNLRPQTTTGFTTFGCIWEQGTCAKEATYVCKNEQGQEVAMQTRNTAFWADGSVKWTAHTVNTQDLGNEITVEQGTPAVMLEKKIKVEEKNDRYVVYSGALYLEIPKQGQYLVTQVKQNGKDVLREIEPILQLEKPIHVQGETAKVVREYVGKIEKVTWEETGPLQAIVKYEGIHETSGNEQKIPFIIRMTLGLDGDDLKFMHTFLYDGKEDEDFLKGIGLTCKMPMKGKLYNRHIKCMNDHGMFHESIVPLLSWRPRIPEALYEKQMNAEQLVLTGVENEIVEQVLKDTPYWSCYDICQDSATHFMIRKKLQGEQLCYIDALHGKRTEGGIAIGSEQGSILMSIRDFWQKYPSGYTLRDLETQQATCTLWFWSPTTNAFDYRHYAERGYNQVCYEGYDYKGADPVGIACTSECCFRFHSAMMPADEEIVACTKTQNEPAVYVETPEEYHDKKAFGYWSLPSYHTEMETWLEKQLEQVAEFYLQEVEQRGWYGMYNYGDFMHSYDSKRHQWKYDIGGYAWDNTELVPTLWLWLYFMRTGREDIFTLAEKLVRHASEVDVYHFGRYKGLGSRHNVRHWGCPCKEARIAMAGHHRFLYYMTGDRRFEDIFEELKDNEESFLNRDPLGDFYKKEEMVYPSHARSGPDWSSLCSNWMTQWERTLDPAYKEKIEIGLGDIKKAPLQLSSGPDFEFDPHSLHLRYIGERTTGGCHLQICMGAPQIWMEMADLFDDEELKKMIADYGRFYYLPHEEQQKESQGLIGNRESSLPFMAAAMGAYGAAYKKDSWLAQKTWQILLQTILAEQNEEGFTPIHIPNCGNQASLTEIPWISTNFAAQWGLNVIMVLEFIKKELPKTIQEAEKLVKGMPENLFRKA